MQRDRSYLYPIQTHETHFFYAGLTADGRSVLMGLLCPHLLGIFFDSQGNLLEMQKRFLEFLQLSGVYVDGQLIERLVRRYNAYDRRIPPRLQQWQQEIGFTPATIRIKRFILPDLGVGIEDYPSHFAEILDDPKESEEEKASTRESMQEWQADGQFVLCWGNDYWLNGEGEVTSS